MNHKTIFLICLLIFAIGAVSACDEVSLNDTLTQDSTQEIICDSGYQKESLNIYDSVNVDESYDSIADVFDDDYLNGTVTASIDDEVIFDRTFTANDEEYYCSISIADLKQVPGFGSHKVNLSYQKNSNGKAFTMSRDVEFTYTFYTIVNGEMNDAYLGGFDEYEIGYSNDLDFNAFLANGANGLLTIKINGKSFKVNVKNGKAKYKISTGDFKIGVHDLYAQFSDNSKLLPVKTIHRTIIVKPDIYWPYDMSSGENDVIQLLAPKKTNLKVILYQNSNGKCGKQIASYSTKKGILKIPLKKLVSLGSNHFYLNYTAGDFKGFETIDIDVFKNDRGFKSSIKKTGDSVKISLTGPKTNDDVELYLDNRLFKSLNFKKGKINVPLSKLSIGKHKINIKLYGEKYYSKTFFVTVKAKDKVSLRLDKVAVKKSATKLVLKSTLKINKKAKKGLKVTFKFNGKKYVAKTDKKGIAKVSIKKKVLRNLNVGKKVKYQVKYSFKTISKTAKVMK